MAFKYKAVITDIDGTLLNQDRALSARTVEVIRSLSRHVPVILASSRMPKAMRHLQAELEILHCPLICYNGGYVIHFPEGGAPEVLHSTEIPLEACRTISRLAEGTDVHVSLYREDEWYVPREDEWAARERNNTRVSPTLSHPEEVYTRWHGMNAGAHKVMCMGPADQVQALIEALEPLHGDTLSLYRSKPTYLEVAHKAISKATALQLLLDRIYPIGLHEVIAFGDNTNDMEMLQAVGMGVAVGNAKDEVKAIAHAVTAAGKEDGVALALERWMLSDVGYGKNSYV